ncbi:hypothetical protein BU23DRAFT_565428 [Bimuria novae-zelandiae CBS 107.79]|uniref:Uncharacterized protein n=1 Tax=Bimuria novae-zelandiae CBS 107.79 TaxID=1447943 RepID=A0A6A5VM08_9PLEO|nr:hypothetical protein BU23DRAFT_565428 [Bimuria novae-zelandiae CBS 107.79]
MLPLIWNIAPDRPSAVHAPAKFKVDPCESVLATVCCEKDRSRASDPTSVYHVPTKTKAEPWCGGTRCAYTDATDYVDNIINGPSTCNNTIFDIVASTLDKVSKQIALIGDHVHSAIGKHVLPVLSEHLPLLHREPLQRFFFELLPFLGEKYLRPAHVHSSSDALKTTNANVQQADNEAKKEVQFQVQEIGRKFEKCFRQLAAHTTKLNGLNKRTMTSKSKPTIKMKT